MVVNRLKSNTEAGAVDISGMFSLPIMSANGSKPGNESTLRSPPTDHTIHADRCMNCLIAASLSGQLLNKE